MDYCMFTWPFWNRCQMKFNVRFVISLFSGNCTPTLIIFMCFVKSLTVCCQSINSPNTTKLGILYWDWFVLLSVKISLIWVKTFSGDECIGMVRIVSLYGVSIGSDNGLSPIRHQAIIWTNAWSWSIGPLGTNFSEILIKIQDFSFMKMHLKILSAKWRPFCPGGDELNNKVTVCSLKKL